MKPLNLKQKPTNWSVKEDIDVISVSSSDQQAYKSKVNRLISILNSLKSRNLFRWEQEIDEIMRIQDQIADIWHKYF